MCADGLVVRVRERLAADPGLIPTMEQVASELHVDARTLRRHLASEGATFRGLVDDVRLSAAAELLAGTELSVEEIASRVGFAEPASFTRAFKRWTGEPPATYRSARPRRTARS